MRRVIAFDVNETLLDLSPLDALFEQELGSAGLRRPWFTQALQLSFVGGLTDRYVDFTTAQRAALAMVGSVEGIEVGEDAADRIVEGMRSLPPHPEVAGALEALRAAGFPLAALTNSPLDVAADQLRNAGLVDHFEAILSADEVQAAKPLPAPYALVARMFGVTLVDVRLVAAHDWDVAGALAAGCAAAFVARPGKVLSPLNRPDVIGHDIADVAAKIATADRDVG
jgi:2-haloacid dehalogenase